MTAFAISSGGLEYYDQKTGGSVNATLDTYTVSVGSTLVVRTDTYACANHSAAFGSIDNVAYSGIGGEVIIDPTYVRYVAYTGGSGNSPAFGAAISQGGVSGVFLGVWANWQSEPIVPGAAIPASGFIKIGGVAGGAFSAGALTGITATCSGADLQGWIEVRSAENASITVPRVGKFSSVEAWFYLDNTTGVAGQIIPCPTTATVAQVWPGVWIETAPASGVYERFVGAGAQVPLSTTPTDARAKLVWQTTSGLRLGSDGTNTVGCLPPAGCKVRIPAAILTNCIRTSGSGSGPRVLPNASLPVRAEFIVVNAGYIDLRGVVSQWYMNFSQPFYVKLKSCLISDRLVLSEVATPFDVDDCIVAPTQAQINSALSVTSNFAAGEIKNSAFARFSLASSGAFVVTCDYSTGVAITDILAISLTLRANGNTAAISATQAIDCEFTRCTVVGGKVQFSGSQNCVMTDLVYADSFIATDATNAFYAVEISNACSGIKIQGGSAFAGVTNTHPYNGWVSTINSYKIRVRGLGSFASPFDCGSANAMGVGLNMGGNNVGVDFKRCYLAGTRLNPWAVSNSDNEVVIENVISDYADTSALTSLNSIVKGCGLAGTTTGQSAVYGTHFEDRFTSTTAGVIEIVCNEPVSGTVSQCQVVSGVPLFNASGAVLMTVTGQQIIWEMPYFALGHTALANSALSLAGTNTSNLSYEFQYDLGAGYNGSWLTANATNFAAVGAIDPAVGIKIKLRVTCVTANASNLLTNIRITTVTTSTAQSTNLYPLDTITLTLTGLVAGSDVVVRAAGTSTILASVDSNAGTTWAYVYETPVAIDVDVIKPGYVPKPLLRNYTPSAQNSSLPVSQLLDRNYI